METERKTPLRIPPFKQSRGFYEYKYGDNGWLTNARGACKRKGLMAGTWKETTLLTGMAWRKVHGQDWEEETNGAFRRLAWKDHRQNEREAEEEMGSSRKPRTFGLRPHNIPSCGGIQHEHTPCAPMIGLYTGLSLQSWLVSHHHI